MSKKHCTRCRKRKSTTEFWPNYQARAKGQAKALAAWCKTCHTTDGTRRRRHKLATDPVFRRKHLAADQGRQIARKYGITMADYRKKLASQGGKCAICRTKKRTTVAGVKKQFAVDHDHATGRIRGILCDRCNRAIGLLHDNPQLLRRAASYIEQALGSYDSAAC